jgi:2,4-dienoyl-CoA reductase-like NADH-dependent reductase (Old Yellow Enzyme family)
MELLSELVRLGGLELPHRIVMAPLTRSLHLPLTLRSLAWACCCGCCCGPCCP